MKVLLVLWDGFSKEVDVPAGGKDLVQFVTTHDGELFRARFTPVCGAGNALGMPLYALREWSPVPRGTQQTQNIRKVAMTAYRR